MQKQTKATTINTQQNSTSNWKRAHRHAWYETPMVC
jgi:hypothetical protein